MCIRDRDYYSVVQKELVILGAKLLRPGGSMVYSTCTFSKTETEQVIEHLLANTYDMEHVQSVRMWPQRVRGEGHFAALLHKAGKPSDKMCIRDRHHGMRIWIDVLYHRNIRVCVNPNNSSAFVCSMQIFKWSQRNHAIPANCNNPVGIFGGNLFYCIIDACLLYTSRCV